ncbi:MAG: ABC transporter ATP-binding protein [Candidatus Omnitrophota bacterium]
MSILVSCDKLYGGYGRDTIIKDISFDIKKGEFVGIIGPNGSGKSTLLRLMTRVIPPKSGRVLFENRDIALVDLKELFKKCAFVGQDTVYNFSFSTGEMVLMGRIPHLRRMQPETKKDIEIAKKALQLTDTYHLLNKCVDHLSAGERQRAIIAKALAQEPILLYLDEPTAHLDISYQVQIMDLLRDLNKRSKLTIMIVLHDLNLAGEYCDRLMLLEKGRIVKDSNPEEVLTYENIESVYKTLVLVNKNPISGKPYITLISKETCLRK